MEGTADRVSMRKGAVVVTALFASALLACYGWDSQSNSRRTELFAYPMTSAASAELSSYQNVLSFPGEPKAVPSASDKSKTEQLESAGEDAPWAQRYLKTGELFQGDANNLDTQKAKGMDCYYSHPVAVCDEQKRQQQELQLKQEQQPTEEQQGGGGEAAPSSLMVAQIQPATTQYDASCFYHHSVDFCLALRAKAAQQSLARQEQQPPPRVASRDEEPQSASSYRQASQLTPERAHSEQAVRESSEGEQPVAERSEDKPARSEQAEEERRAGGEVAAKGGERGGLQGKFALDGRLSVRAQVPPASSLPSYAPHTPSPVLS